MLCTPLWSEMGRSSAMAAYAGVASSFSAKRAPKSHVWASAIT